MDAVRGNKGGGPRSFAFHEGHKRRHLAGNAEEVSVFGVLDVWAGLGVEREVLSVRFGAGVDFKPRECRAFGGHVHMPPLFDGAMDERKGSRGMPHSPIQHGDKELRSVVVCTQHRL